MFELIFKEAVMKNPSWVCIDAMEVLLVTADRMVLDLEKSVEHLRKKEKEFSQICQGNLHLFYPDSPKPKEILVQMIGLCVLLDTTEKMFIENKEKLIQLSNEFEDIQNESSKRYDSLKKERNKQ